MTESGAFEEELEKLELDVPGDPCPAKLDFRRVQQAIRESIRHKLEGANGNLELVEHGQLLEHSTAAAILHEIELRLVPEETRIVPPSVAAPNPMTIQ